MADDIELYDSITHSNMPARDKSSVLAMLGQIAGESQPQTLLGTMLSTSISGVVGGTLGLADAELKDGLDYNKKYPLDLILFGFSAATGLIFKSVVSLKVADTAFGVYSFRTVNRLMKSLKPIETTAEEVPQAAE